MPMYVYCRLVQLGKACPYALTCFVAVTCSLAAFQLCTQEGRFGHA